MTKETPLDSTTSVRPAPHVHTRGVGGELVLLHFGRGEYYGLDATGAIIWEQCVGGATLGEAAAHIAARFGISHERALADVLALIDELRRADLVTT